MAGCGLARYGLARRLASLISPAQDSTFREATIAGGARAVRLRALHLERTMAAAPAALDASSCRGAVIVVLGVAVGAGKAEYW